MKRIYWLVFFIGLLICQRNIGAQPENCPKIDLQELTVIFFKLDSGKPSLTINARDQAAYSLTNKEIQILKSKGIRGTLTLEGGGIYGHFKNCPTAKKSRVILIGTKQINRDVTLLQPNEKDLVYFQRGKRWQLLADNPIFLNRTIILRPSKINSTATEFMIENVDGSKSGGTAFIW